jgi:hypothetical protein
MGLRRVKTVRGISDYGYSWVCMLFEDGADPCWARRAGRNSSPALLRACPQAFGPRSAPTRTGSAGSSNTSSSTRPATTTQDGCGPCRIGMCATTSVPFRNGRGRLRRRVRASLPGDGRPMAQVVEAAEACRLLESTDRIVKSFPQVASVLGKKRAERRPPRSRPPF